MNLRGTKEAKTSSHVPKLKCPFISKLKISSLNSVQFLRLKRSLDENPLLRRKVHNDTQSFWFLINVQLIIPMHQTSCQVAPPGDFNQDLSVTPELYLLAQ